MNEKDKKLTSDSEVNVDLRVINAIEAYQCVGCVGEGNIACYEKGEDLACGNHTVGTILSRVGKIFLGLPKGFNRLGVNEKMPINIFEKFKDGWGYDKFNVPVWKHLDENGNTIVRGMCPRVNWTFIHIFLEDCRDKINCYEVTFKDISEMD